MTGEYGASLRLLKMLESMNSQGVAVFMARVFGGTLLGPKHFVHMEKVVKEALDVLEST